MKHLTVIGVLLAALTGAACGDPAGERDAPAPDAEHLTEYRVLLNAAHDSGPYCVTLRIAAAGLGQARTLAERWVERDGAHLLGIEEVEETGPSDAVEPRVVDRTGRSYYDPD